MFGEARGKKQLTPVMRQYQAAKAAHPDAILFFRLGDFYEMFHDDAVVASRALDLTLTSRNKGSADEVPMAGVPYHAAAGYLAKLLSLGHKVAICEQLGDPSKTKGIVAREVVRVLTPGLVTDGDQLEHGEHHYLVALDRDEARGEVGIAKLELSTGELGAALVSDVPSVLAELARLAPREVLVPEGADALFALVRSALPRVAVRTDAPLDAAEARGVVDDTLGAEAAADASRSVPPLALAAATRALRFARACNPGAALPVRRVAAWDPAATLRIDDVTQGHLELVRAVDGAKRGSLLGAIDATRTPLGARLLRKWLLSPLVDPAAIRARLDAVEALVTNPLARDELRRALVGVGDLERLAVRAELLEASPRDLGALRDGLAAAPLAVAAIAAIADPAARAALGLGDAPPDLVPDLAEKLGAALSERPPPVARDGGIIREGYDAALDETAKLRANGTDAMLALEAKLRDESGIASLKVRYTRVFGWYVEVTKSHAAKAPASWRRKQTVATGERYTTEELDRLADAVLHAESRHDEREQALFASLVRDVASEADRLRALAARLAEWDVFAGLADVAHRRDFIRPDVDASEVLVVEDGRHPVVEELTPAGHFVPNDVALDTERERLLVVTGPNMAGKSTLMRQVALIVILAQMGSYVPAKRARVGVVDRVLSRVGASDNLSRGESTFMVEMRETSEILRRATRKSLVILDEIGRGTSTYDGLAIAWAVAEHLHDVVGCRGLFATHYHEMTELIESAPHAANFSVSAREVGDDVVFLHKLVRGPASRSYGVAVARLAGLPEGVLARAKAILHSLETSGTLPGGKHATMRGRTKKGGVQLDLFQAASAPATAPSEVEATIAAVDLDRMTPLEALQLIAKLKSLV